MQDREDYYKILDIPPNADEEEITRAYEHKVRVLRFESSKKAARHIRYYAEKDLRKVRQAYSTLSSPVKRRKYDREYMAEVLNEAASGMKPQPQVDPDIIRFDNVEPYAAQSASFVISNTGDLYRELTIEEPPPWIRIVEKRSLSEKSELPMQVRFEAVGTRWGDTLSGNVTVALDSAKARVRVRLQTVVNPDNGERTETVTEEKPVTTVQADAARSSKPRKKRRIRIPTIWRYLLIAMLIIIMAGIIAYAIVYYPKSTAPSSPASTTAITPEPYVLYGDVTAVGGAALPARLPGESLAVDICTLCLPYGSPGDAPGGSTSMRRPDNDGCNGAYGFRGA